GCEGTNKVMPNFPRFPLGQKGTARIILPIVRTIRAVPFSLWARFIWGLSSRRDAVSMTAMRSWFVKILALGCSLLLVLPHGWCCALDNLGLRATPAAPTHLASAPEETGACCPCCKHSTPSNQAPKEQSPSKPAKRCCCDDRQALKVSPSSVEQAG